MIRPEKNTCVSGHLTHPMTADDKTFFIQFFNILPLWHHSLQCGPSKSVSVFSMTAADVFQILSMSPCLIPQNGSHHRRSLSFQEYFCFAWIIFLTQSMVNYSVYSVPSQPEMDTPI